MDRVISWLPSTRLRQIATIFLIGLIFVISIAFDQYGSELQARAEPVTPEANKYQVDRTSSQIHLDTENVKEKAQDKAKELAEDTKQATKSAKGNTRAAGKNLVQNLKEKLNLDEPIDTPKESLKNVAEKMGTYRE